MFLDKYYVKCLPPEYLGVHLIRKEKERKEYGSTLYTSYNLNVNFFAIMWATQNFFLASQK